MTDGDCERVFERAAEALRTPDADDERGRERLLRAIYADASNRRAVPRGAALPWWGALAAAALAFAIGLGAGRAGAHRSATSASGVVASDSGVRRVEFVFVAPSASNVALVGDFNGWDATATPMRRIDGRTTWSVAVPLEAGRHVYAFVVDGTAWVADPQAPLAPEQWFGDRKSVVVVPVGDHRS